MRGFPSFFSISSKTSEPVRIKTNVSSDEFIKLLKQGKSPESDDQKKWNVAVWKTDQSASQSANEPPAILTVKTGAPVLPAASPVVTASTASSADAASGWSAGWYKGTSGYAKGLEEYRKTKKPMIVYVSVSWCPYCRKLENGNLSSPAVQNYLKDMIKVNINPESSEQENELASRYGVRGYPSFYLHPPQPSRTVQINTGVSPEQFVESFKQALQ